MISTKFPSFVVVFFFSRLSLGGRGRKNNHSHLQQLKNTTFIVKVQEQTIMQQVLKSAYYNYSILFTFYNKKMLNSNNPQTLIH